MTRISLLKLNNIDNTYTNTMDFDSKSSRDNFFNSKVIKTYDINTRDDMTVTTLTLPVNHSEINNLNYLFFSNEKNERYYFFILNHEHRTNFTTLLNIQLDVFTTYWNDITLKESFVDRCHVPRWSGDIPTVNTIDEGFPLNEYVLESVQEITSYNDGLIISSTQPLGVCPGFKLPGIGGGGSTGGACEGDITKGILSSKGFRFIKGYEAFGPYEYDDGFGYMTIAYGVTRHGEPDIYNQLAAMQPVPEETGAKISYQLKIDNYGLKIKDQFLKIYSTTDITKFDAVMSFVFNLGVGMMNDGNSFYEALKTKDEATIRTQWLKYINANGQPVEGLRLRREAELKIFFTGLYDFRPIPLLNQAGSIIGTVTENRGDGWLPTCEGSDLPQVENSLGEWSIPTTGEITAIWPNYPSGGEHSGIDIANSLNTPIYAARSGTVEAKELTTSYGKHIIITHQDGSKSYYAHMNSLSSATGDNVTEGQEIGKMGTTGNSTGVHLHWEIRPATGGNINPMPGYKVGDKV